jgi:hypothetical protein
MLIPHSTILLTHAGVTFMPSPSSCTAYDSLLLLCS